MQNWLEFFNFLFWVSIISFLTNFNSIIRLLFYSEISWILLYCLLLLQGSINDDLNLISTSIFILGLAGIEYGLGIILILIFKDINKKTDLNEFDNFSYNYKLFSSNSVYINRYIWKK